MRKHVAVLAAVALLAPTAMLALPALAGAHTAHHRTAHSARCGNACKIASTPDWVCILEGGAVAAGISAITGGTAGAVAASLGGSFWSAGCVVEPTPFYIAGLPWDGGCYWELHPGVKHKHPAYRREVCAATIV